VSDYFQQPVKWFSHSLMWFEQRQMLQNENVAIKKLLHQQQALLQELNVVREENQQLRQLLHVPPLSEYEWIAARIQSHSVQRQSQHLIIQAEHLKTNDVVVSKGGLVGLVEQVQDSHATVRTLLNGSLAIPVTTKDHQLVSLLRGQADSLHAEFIAWKNRPYVDDILYTSGAGGLFPEGIPVARVLKVKKVAGSQFAKVKVRALSRWQGNAWLAVARKVQP